MCMDRAKAFKEFDSSALHSSCGLVLQSDDYRAIATDGFLKADVSVCQFLYPKFTTFDIMLHFNMMAR